MLQKTCKELMDVVKDTELESRITGVALQMETFDYLYGFMLGKMILGHSVNLSRTLQERNTSVAEGQEVAEIVVQNQPGYKVYCQLQQLLFRSAKGEDYQMNCSLLDHFMVLMSQTSWSVIYKRLLICVMRSRLHYSRLLCMHT